MTLTRRDVLRGLGLGGLGLGGLGLGGGLLSACSRGAAWAEPDVPVVDFHTHLFGIGDGASGCHLSEQQKQHPNYGFLMKLLGLEESRGGLDEQYVDALVAQLRGSKVDLAVLLAQDGRYDERGRPRREDTHFYVPNGWLFEVVSRYPDLFVPCASINPKRRDALDELERCAERGARLVKVHPPTQDVDPGNPAFAPFYRRMAELDVILMVHTGTEHASQVVGYDNCDPERLELALQEGCAVVAAHSGFGSFLDGLDFFPSMQSMVRRFPKLFCDTAVLASSFRWRNLPRLLDDTLVLARTLHGSDFPFPSNPMVFWNRLGVGDLAALLEERNLFERDLGLKRAMGFDDAYVRRGAEVLGLA